MAIPKELLDKNLPRLSMTCSVSIQDMVPVKLRQPGKWDEKPVDYSYIRTRLKINGNRADEWINPNLTFLVQIVISRVEVRRAPTVRVCRQL